MPPVPEDAFRDLLGGCSDRKFAAFVADLWRARGHDVRRTDGRLLVDGGVLWPMLDAADESPDGVTVVSATEPPADADDAIGPAKLRRLLLYDVPRAEAAELFDAHFDRPLDDDWTDERWTTRPADSTADGTTDDAPADDSGPPSRRLTASERFAAVTTRLPRDRDDLRALAGDRRVQVGAAVALVVLAAVLWGLFLYQPGPGTTDEPPFAVANPPPPDDDGYRIVGQVHTTVDGSESFIGESRTYVAAEPAVAVSRRSFGGVGSRSTRTAYERADATYVRQSWANDSAYRENSVRYSGPNIVYESEDTRSIYTVRSGSGRVSADPPPTFARLLLAQIPYERRGTTTHEGTTVVRFVPTTGWVTRDVGTVQGDGPGTTRVRSATGEVLVDPETGTVLSADVEATMVNADTWAGALTGQRIRLRIRYRVDLDVARPGTPPWVEGLDANTTVGTRRLVSEEVSVNRLAVVALLTRGRGDSLPLDAVGGDVRGREGVERPLAGPTRRGRRPVRPNVSVGE